MTVAPGFKDIGKRMRNIPMLVDLDERFRVMDRFDDYQQVLSIADAADRGLRAARGAPIWPARANDGMAELVAQSSGSVSRIRRLAAARRSRRRDA